MENRNDSLLCLALLPGISARAQQAAQDRGLEEVLAHPADHADLLNARARGRLTSGEAWADVAKARRDASKAGRRIVSREEPDYPPLLREIFDPPPVLWVRGALVPDEQLALGVVGSRSASPAGLALAREMSRELAACGVTIVSGLARGIDAAAHAGALRGGGRTVAVLGSGLDRPYPRENLRLLRAIVEAGGAVVSEFPPECGPRREHFPRRNRVVAGWGRGVVIVEAAQRSGALITARVANDEGREVFAVPAHPFHEAGAGGNKLLRDGATLVRGAADVLDELKIERAPNATQAGRHSADPLLSALHQSGPMSVDELCARSGLPAASLLARLSELELASRVERLPGNLYLER